MRIRSIIIRYTLSTFLLVGGPYLRFAAANPVDESPTPEAAGGASSSPSAANPDAFLSSSGGMVNDFTGVPAFSVPLGSLSGNNGLQYEMNLNYFGAVQYQDESHLMFSSPSWVGEGFTMAWPQIFSDMKGTATLDDDDYYLSLDGQPVKMVGVTGNINRFVLKNNRFITINRSVTTVSGQTATDPWAGVSESPPTTPFTFNVTYVSGWTITLPDGKVLDFPFSGNCDTDNKVLCTHVMGDRVGYQPFYNFSVNAKVPDQWNIGTIKDLDGKFVLGFEYDPKPSQTVTGVEYFGPGAPARPQVKADRAVHLKRVISYNGTGADWEATGEVIFERMDKPVGPSGGSEWFGWPAHDPLIRYDTQCLSRIVVKSRGQIARTLEFSYGTTANDKLRLQAINAIEPVKGKSRLLKYFGYHPLDTWKLVLVKDGSGLETEFEWGTVEPYSGNIIKVPDWVKTVKGQVTFKIEYGNNLFLSMDNSTSCTEQDLLFHYVNNGVHWELSRVFRAPWNGCKGKWFMPADGSYMGYYQVDRGTVSMRIYELPLKDIPGGLPTWVDLRGDPPQYNPQSFSFPDLNGDGRTSMFPFKNWMAYHAERSLTVFFFHKTNGVWRDGNHNAAGALVPCVVPYATRGVLSGLQASGCINYSLYSSNKVEVRGGDEMITVLQRSETYGSSIFRVYGYNNGIKEYTKGIMKSARQKNVTVKQGLYYYDHDIADAWAESTNKILDFSVSGRMVVVHDEGLSSKNLFVFAYDGYQLRFLYQEKLDTYLDQIFAGPDYFVRKDIYSMDGEGTGNWYYYKVDPAAWKVYKSGPLYPTSQTGLNYWTCKPMQGYFHLEKMTIPAKAFETAVFTRWGHAQDYLHSNQTGLFVISGNNGEVATQINPSPWSYNLLGNVTIAGDKMMGVRLTQNRPGYVDGYFYGNLKHSPLNAPVWDVRAVDIPSWSGWDVMSGYPISSGAIFLSMWKNPDYTPYWNGEIYFVPENKVWFNGVTEDRRPTSVITKVHTRTKSYLSLYEDGSLKTIDFYRSDATYNGMMRVANFGKVIKKFWFPFQTTQSNEIFTDYVMDHVSPEGVTALPIERKSLHGSPFVSETNLPWEKEWPGFPPAGSKNFSTFGALTYTTTTDNLPLKEKVYLPWAHTTTSQTRFHRATMTSTVRSALLDEMTGVPRISVVQKGSDYYVTLTRFEHEFTGALPYDLVRQTSTYLSKGVDPCTGPAADDPCGNLTLAKFGEPGWQLAAIGSTVNKYAEGKFLSEVWEWRPAVLGTTPLTTLDGNTSAGTWVKTGSILQRNRDVPAARAKDISPTLVEKAGVFSTTFYGGPEAYKLGTVINADRNTCTLLSGEEESVMPNAFGAFGEWSPAGSVLTTELPHTGKRSFKVTQVYGPSVNIPFRSGADAFWSRKKGFKISGWIYAKGSNDGGASDPFPGFVIELRPATGDPVRVIDLFSENGAKAFLPYNRWIKLERIVTWEELNASIPNAGAYLRIWAGKQNSSNTHPVYVDDIRIHPTDASVLSTQNFDEVGTVTSALDENNDPVFFRYNVWGVLMGAKDKNGLAHSSKASKRFDE